MNTGNTFRTRYLRDEDDSLCHTAPRQIINTSSKTAMPTYQRHRQLRKKRYTAVYETFKTVMATIRAPFNQNGYCNIITWKCYRVGLANLDKRTCRQNRRQSSTRGPGRVALVRQSTRPTGDTERRSHRSRADQEREATPMYH